MGHALVAAGCRSLALLGVAALLAPAANADWPPPRPLEVGRLEAAGLRVVQAQRATLVTDLSVSEEIDGLPGLIDLAVPIWAKRFETRVPDGWRLRVYLIEDEARFRSLGLWPEKSPDFPHGLSLGYEVWLREQAIDYYRRHLLLHEGTHSFMSTRLGSCGPGWYMEGVAELCGTHALDGERLRLAVMPASSEAAPDWGRVRLIRDAIAAGRRLSIDAVRKIDNRSVLETESYAWVWALCHFLDKHPAYRERFGKLSGWVTSDNFARRFRRLYAKDRQRLDQEWRLFCETLAYGHDLEREAIDFNAPAANGSRPIRIEADRGWQSTGVRIEAGRTYRIGAEGRFKIGEEPDGTPWPCEPNGITLAYHAGRPLGELLATVDAGPGAFVQAVPIGIAGDFTPPASGTLFLRLNDSPASLAENAGSVSVSVGR